jgi:hypothetical protein
MRYHQAIWRVLESRLVLVIWLVVYLCVGFWMAYRWHASIWLKILATILNDSLSRLGHDKRCLSA